MKSAPPQKKKAISVISFIFGPSDLGQLLSPPCLPNPVGNTSTRLPWTTMELGRFSPRFAAASVVPKICLPNGGGFHGLFEPCGRIREKKHTPKKQTNKQTNKKIGLI